VQLDDIYEPIWSDLQKVEQRLKAAIDVDVPFLSQLLDYVLESSGKRTRPAITLFAGKFYHYDVALLVPAAAAMELVHTATLVHDDIVDNSTQRRNKATINYLQGKTNAVLLGDYLFGRAAALAAATENIRVMKLFSRAAMTISSGELRRNISSYDLELTRENYFQWISAKTACLFSTAAGLGAILGRSPERATQSLQNYGYNLGMAFQVVDDVLDFVGKEAELGKALGSDLSQGILTLPIILFLERYPEDVVIKKALGSDDGVDVEAAISRICQSSVIEDCLDIASGFCQQACRALENLPCQSVQSKMIDLVHYVIQRRK
jgi:geranylgeranyl pyrophosphate synthase